MNSHSLNFANSPTIYIGVDNGVTGGLVALSPQSQIIASLRMPTLKARAGKEIDIATVHQWISEIDSREKIQVVIEEPGGSKSAMAAKSMSGSFHALRALCVIKGLRWHRITPAKWQKAMLPGCAAGETKPRALSCARELWPSETFIPAGCRVPDEGLIDAALIGEYARRNLL